MKNQTVTKCYVKTMKNGEPTFSITSEDAFNRKVKEAAVENTEAPVLVNQQTVSLALAETLEEALQLSGGDESVAVAHFNYGAGLRQHNEANDLISEDGFQPVEGALDLAYAVSQKSEGRRKMSNEEKAAKALGVTPEQLKAALALLSQQAATAHATA